MASPEPRHARRAAAAVLAASALALASCSAPGDEAPQDASGATLEVGLVLEPTNLDIRHTAGAALEQALIGNVYEGLVARSGADIVPALATAWSVSDDGLEYTFTLAGDVTFHGGQDMTADDVVASLEAVRGDETAIGHDELAGVAEVAAIDEGTVRVALAEPDQGFLFALTGPAGLVLDADDETDMLSDANGTGPFALESWNQGDSIVLARNDAYWGDPAGVAEVVLRYIPEPTALVAAGLDGSLDALTGIDAELAPQLEGSLTVTSGPTTDKFILAFNDEAAPLDDVRVREALRLAIDHDAIVEVVGAGVTQFGPVPELDPGYEDLSNTISFDPERARDLLAEAGVQDLSLELTIPSAYGTTASTLLVSAFADIGVELEVSPVEFSTWLQDVFTNHDYELSYVNHVEPRDFSTWTDADYYYAIADDDARAEIADTYAEAMRETDPDVSAALIADAARLVAAQHPADWLYTREDVVAVATGVEGFPTSETSTRLPLARVHVAGS
ncbi:ABC transporter substrate-binding protein [Microbacterium sp. ZXX196]|uniref:ABC transporter substrate-binding protein n=1 Tax=Microbacterium sp. ZXX196 TaxID=2609291 RepID=UPI0012B8E2F4|nr:ABC transporter substrate-binding protein [Microbacterium sp. ZXX196]MTE23057.1 ABC transporter substrate-binding protein [Microbacterium sp. ZXX196]